MATLAEEWDDSTMRSLGGAVLTAAGVAALLGFFGSIAKAVEVWRSPQTTCVFDHRPGAEGFCVSTVSVTGLAKVPWTYLGLGVALLVLAVCLFTLRERIRPES
jgi:hypothetical protein